MKTLSFNTGNPYTIKGQRLAFGIIPEGIALVDIDRNVHGIFKTEEPNKYFSRSSLVNLYNDNLFRDYLPYSSPVFQALQDEARALPCFVR